MGAWGTGVFEDDTALDFIEEQLISLQDPRALMREVFDAALSADYVDYEAGHAVLVSAAAIKAAQSDEPFQEDEDEEWAEWRASLTELDFSQLKPLAAKACLRVCADQSELCELWAENGELFPEWKAGIQALANTVGDGS